MEELGKAMGRIGPRTAVTRCSSSRRAASPRSDFLDRLADELEPAIGHRPEMHRFAEIYFEALNPN